MRLGGEPPLVRFLPREPLSLLCSPSLRVYCFPPFGRAPSRSGRDPPISISFAPCVRIGVIALDPPPLFSHVCAPFLSLRARPCVSRVFSYPIRVSESRAHDRTPRGSGRALSTAVAPCSCERCSRRCHASLQPQCSLCSALREHGRPWRALSHASTIL